MALSKPTLKAEIVAFMAEQASITDSSQTPAQAIDNFAEGLSTAIDNYIRSGLVETTGTSTAQTGHVI